MLKFTRLDEKNIFEIKDYLTEYGGEFCDLSVGVKYMWRDDFKIDYAIYNNTLIMKETTPEYENAFYYPLGQDVDGALEKIENYTKENFIPLRFCCIDNLTTEQFVNRYHAVHIENDRAWSDYIYDAEKFKTYSGKKFSGQRNHVNKFTKLYPNYKFKVIERSDFSRIKEFLDEFNAKLEFLRWTEEAEQQKVFELVENMFELGQVGGLIEIDGKVVAFSIGEKIKDTLIVHIEKALTKYEGVYPTMAKEFAIHFADSSIKFINREEDCGDDGLRISKLQYKPIDIKEKNFVCVKTLFDKICPPINIRVGELTISDHAESDKLDYYNLYMDDELNKWWGYDYREDLGDKEPSPDYFFSFQNALKAKKEEYSLLVRLSGAVVDNSGCELKENSTVIGELVLHNFDYFGGVEIGFRFFNHFQKRGYATISAKALIDYAFNNLGATTVKTRCFKQNIPSFNLINRLGFSLAYENDTHYFFEQKRI